MRQLILSSISRVIWGMGWGFKKWKIQIPNISGIMITPRMGHIFISKLREMPHVIPLINGEMGHDTDRCIAAY